MRMVLYAQTGSMSCRFATFNPEEAFMGNGNGNMIVFATTAGRPLALEVCKYLSIDLGKAIIGRFNDSEVNVKIDENVRGNDVFIIAPLNPPAENFLEAIWLASAARLSSAARVTYVIPYMGYARADRKPASRMPIGIRLAFGMLELAQPDRMIVLDIHAEQSFVSLRDAIPDHLFGSAVLVPVLKETLGTDRYVVASPDRGGTTRAGFYAKRLTGGSDFVILSKERSEAGVVDEGAIRIIGDVEDRTIVFVDDIIDTGGTMIAGARAVKRHGANKVIVCATHGIFSRGAMQRFEESDIDEVYVTDSIPHDLSEVRKYPKIKIVSIAQLLGMAIRRTNAELSLSELIPQ